MLQVTGTISKSQLCFDCPNCGARDIIYIKQNKSCHLCYVDHEFDIPQMMMNAGFRFRYHFKNRLPREKDV